MDCDFAKAKIQGETPAIANHLLRIYATKNYTFDCEFVQKHHFNSTVLRIPKTFGQMFEKTCTVRVNKLAQFFRIPSVLLLVVKIAHVWAAFD